MRMRMVIIGRHVHELSTARKLDSCINSGAAHSCCHFLNTAVVVRTITEDIEAQHGYFEHNTAKQPVIQYHGRMGRHHCRRQEENRTKGQPALSEGAATTLP